MLDPPNLDQGIVFKPWPLEGVDDFVYHMTNTLNSTECPPAKKARSAGAHHGLNASASSAVEGLSSDGAAPVPPAARRADADGWPRLWFHDIVGEKGMTFLRHSMNKDGEDDIRATCGLCGATRSRTCKPGASGQGRMMGGLYHWCGFNCGGDRERHRELPWGSLDDRIAARSNFINKYWRGKVAQDILKAERKVDPAKDRMGEPIHLP